MELTNSAKRINQVVAAFRSLPAEITVREGWMRFLSYTDETPRVERRVEGAAYLMALEIDLLNEIVEKRAGRVFQRTRNNLLNCFRPAALETQLRSHGGNTFVQEVYTALDLAEALIRDAHSAEYEPDDLAAMVTTLNRQEADLAGATLSQELHSLFLKQNAELREALDLWAISGPTILRSASHKALGELANVSPGLQTEIETSQAAWKSYVDAGTISKKGLATAGTLHAAAKHADLLFQVTMQWSPEAPAGALTNQR